MGAAVTPSVATATGTWRGTGILYKEYGLGGQREIGAHQGDVKFSRDVEFKETSYNGQYGPQKSMKVITKSVPMIEFDLLELSYQNFEDCWAGLVVTDAGAYHQVAEDLAVAAGDYHDNIAFFGERHDGKYWAVLIENALGESKLEMAFKAHEDVVAGAKFVGHYDSSTPTTPPWSLRLED